MKNFLRISFCVALSSALLTGCVTQKKYDDLAARKLDLDRQLAECDKNLAQARTERVALDEQLAVLTKSRAALENDTLQTGIILRKTQGLYRELSDTYEKLLRNHEKLMSNSAAESSRLLKDLQRRENEMKSLEETLSKSKSQIDQLSGDLQTREQRLNELERVLAEKEKAVANLRNKVSNALLGFKDSDISVNVRNGKVYVSLAEQLLFKSGSTKVDAKGQDALQKLAQALKDQQDVNVLVEGHTDDVPLRPSAAMQDNWDLSVLRATEITRIMTNAGLDPKRVTPSGRAFYVPVDEAKTADARQKNRRTEIILTPKLDELFQILEQN
ncbi:MAG: OmpA family protein [Hymenobacteraceae bacterium]|nr:OmpA family protein [Hymenobacteraceae bacterium]MDX5397354.1 OmpA family protein [Hymenobacteraceae bacterium]MDX5513433.1 OmpA family protein [Hymenobacteraceae bacterium]